MPKAKPLLFFDFDGVIVDSFAFSYQIHALIEQISEADFRRLFEGNLHEAIKTPVDQNLEKSAFFTQYGPHLFKQAVVPGMEEVIKQLSQENTLVVVSSGVSSIIATYLEGAGLLAFFAALWGADVEHSKVIKIERLLSKYENAPTNSLFITDTLGDIREATIAGVQSLGVTWGFHSVATLEQGNPWRIVSQPAELVTAVQDYYK